MGDEAIRVKVVCRVRPLNEKERASGDESVVKFPSSSCVALGQRNYNYDHVFQPVSAQVDVYSTAAKPLVKDVLSGYNATIFAYGQTSSGKTHTMEGVLESSDLRGIIPRIVGDIFEHIYAMDANLEIHIKISYFEIYMEKVRDLLDVTKANLPIGESKNKVPYVKGITERFATSPEEVLAVIEEGKSNRRVAVTNMNAHSSRSHAVFLIAIKQENKETRQTLTGKLYLVDLAGSEKVDKTNAQGLTLEEAKTINKSLLALSNVISALSEGNKPFIPYRDSKLTRVLQESLGGNARTTLIICCSPSPYNEAETKSTLQFGERAKSIKNKVAVNIELTAEEWRRRFEKEREMTQRLRIIVQQQEAELTRWRAGETVPETERSKVKLKLAAASPVTEELPVAMTAHGALGVNVPAAGATPTVTPSVTPSATPTPVQTRAFEEERTRLCQQIDEKEEELQAQSELVENLTMKLGEIEENFEELQKENTTIKKQVTVIEHELVSSQEEVQEVMQALEELAVSYDTKDREMGAVYNEKLILLQENERIQSVLEQRILELDKLRETTGLDRRKHNEILQSLFREVNDVSSVLSPNSEEWVPLSGSASSTTPPPDITDEDFTRVRVQLSNMRCEARSLTEQRAILEQAEREARDKAQAVMKELANCKLKLSQYETHNETLTSSLKRSELQKRDLEESLHSLEGQLQDMRGREEVLTRVEREREQRTEGLAHISRELEELLQDQRQSYQKQLALLQEEITAKETQIAQITEQYRAQVLEIDTLNSELSQLNQLYAKERAHYASVRQKVRVREQVKSDLGGLSETVSHQLDRLNDLRDAYFKCLAAKLKPRGSDDTMATASPSNRELHFVEKNLEEMTRLHKKTVSENAEMQREIPRLHSVLAVKSKRIGELENMLRELKETSSREYDRLRLESERIRQSFMAKLKEKEREYQQEKVVRRQGPQIVRPVIQHRTPQSTSSRDTLLAGAGVTVIGQRRKPHQLSLEQDSTPIHPSSSSTAAAAVTGGGEGGGGRGTNSSRGDDSAASDTQQTMRPKQRSS